MADIDISLLDSTAPIFLNREANNPSNRTTVALIFTVLFASFGAFFLFQFVINPWRLGSERWQKAQLESEEAVRQLRNNFWLILTQLGTFAIQRRQIEVSKGKTLIPFFFLAIIFISIVIIQVAVSSKYTPAKWWGDIARPDINISQAQAGFILFFIGCNGYLVLRIAEYYQLKTEFRKKIAAHSYAAPRNQGATAQSEPVGDGTQLPAKVRLNRDSRFLVAQQPASENVSLRSITPPVTDNLEVLGPADGADNKFLESQADQIVEAQEPRMIRTLEYAVGADSDNFDDEFQYIRRMKHILPQYNKISFTAMNAVQIFLLDREILGAFVEPLGCISSSYEPLWPPKPGSTQQQAAENQAAAILERRIRCSSVLIYPSLNIWLAIFGYVLAYYVFTIFKTSEDPRPQEGIISFTTRSEVLAVIYTVLYFLFILKMENASSAPREGIKYSGQVNEEVRFPAAEPIKEVISKVKDFGKKHGIFKDSQAHTGDAERTDRNTLTSQYSARSTGPAQGLPTVNVEGDSERDGAVVLDLANSEIDHTKRAPIGTANRVGPRGPRSETNAHDDALSEISDGHGSIASRSTRISQENDRSRTPSQTNTQSRPESRLDSASTTNPANFATLESIASRDSLLSDTQFSGTMKSVTSNDGRLSTAPPSRRMLGPRAMGGASGSSLPLQNAPEVPAPAPSPAHLNNRIEENDSTIEGRTSPAPPARRRFGSRAGGAPSSLTAPDIPAPAPSPSNIQPQAHSLHSHGKSTLPGPHPSSSHAEIQPSSVFEIPPTEVPVVEMTPEDHPNSRYEIAPPESLLTDPQPHPHPSSFYEIPPPETSHTVETSENPADSKAQFAVEGRQSPVPPQRRTHGPRNMATTSSAAPLRAPETTAPAPSPADIRLNSDSTVEPAADNGCPTPPKRRSMLSKSNASMK
ncbi:hypothetical protein HDU96_006568 [Phlyctochytrium bullatum]|nr:hypothetical protein HDU96_006568 [Phlyctochytrium bullatum]